MSSKKFAHADKVLHTVFEQKGGGGTATIDFLQETDLLSTLQRLVNILSSSKLTREESNKILDELIFIGGKIHTYISKNGVKSQYSSLFLIKDPHYDKVSDLTLATDITASEFAKRNTMREFAKSTKRVRSYDRIGSSLEESNDPARTVFNILVPSAQFI